MLARFSVCVMTSQVRLSRSHLGAMSQWQVWLGTTLVSLGLGLSIELSHRAIAAPLPVPSVEDLSPRSRLGGTSSDPMRQLTSVSALQDVKPTDWAFQALQSLVERYGCLVGYPDKTYRGHQAINRYEFAAGLNACLNRINELMQAGNANLMAREDLAKLQTLQEQFVTELAPLRGRLDALEAQVTQLEAAQFSTTTVLMGITVFGLQGRGSNQADIAPRDGRKETGDPSTNVNLINFNQLYLTTYFTPKSHLRLGLFNSRGSSGIELTNDVRMSYDFFDSNGSVVISDLNYRFLIGDRLAGFIGTEGVNMTYGFRGPNPAENAATGALSYFAQRNPLLNIGTGRGGVGLDWQIAKRISLQAMYTSSISGFFVGEDTPGHSTTSVQLAITPTDTVDLTIYYVNDYSPDGNLLSFVGDAQLTAVRPATGKSAPLTTNAIGTTATWQISPGLTLGGWFGYTNSHIPGRSGTVTTTNWMAFLNFPDLFGKGNLGGIYVGQPPKITRSTLPVGNNIPDWLDTGEGKSGGQPGTTTHIEAFYRWSISDHISLTPGVILILQPRHTPDSDPIFMGILRTSFIF